MADKPKPGDKPIPQPDTQTPPAGPPPPTPPGG
jgi:hypothetical protein